MKIVALSVIAVVYESAALMVPDPSTFLAFAWAGGLSAYVANCAWKDGSS